MGSACRYERFHSQCCKMCDDSIRHEVRIHLSKGLHQHIHCQVWLATFSLKTGMLELRQGVKPVFTICEPCLVLVILMHGFEPMSASYEEFCLLSDELHALLPGTVIHLLVKQTEEWLLSYPAWLAIDDTDQTSTYIANAGKVFRIIHYLLEEVAMAIRTFDNSPLDPKLELYSGI